MVLRRSGIYLAGFLGLALGTLCLPVPPASAQSCGDDFCNFDGGENCATCPQDCGQCEGSVCGNGVLENPEQCDDGSNNGTPQSCCSSDCQLVADGTACNDQSPCTFPDTCASGVCSGTSHFSACVDDFTCYDVAQRGRDEKFHTVPRVRLTDEFESAKFDVLGPGDRRICNPSEKDGEGIEDSTTHLLNYRLSLSATDPPQQKFVPRKRVGVFNVFGTVVVNVLKPVRLLVPAAKSREERVGPPDPESHHVDHYKCYDVEVSKKAAPFTPIRGVALGDQFYAFQLYTLLKPKLLCTPVAKREEGIRNPDVHLMCYTMVRRSCTADAPGHSGGAYCVKEEDCGGRTESTSFCQPGSPRTKIRPVFAADQFGAYTLEASEERHFCVPSVVLEDN